MKKTSKEKQAINIIKKCCLLTKTELAFTNKIEITKEEYKILKKVI